MADKGITMQPARNRSPQQRVRTLAQAALNADATVEQLEALLSGVTETIDDLNQATVDIGSTMTRFNETLDQIEELAPKLIAMVDKMETIVARVERIVDVGEAVVSPFALTENVLRGAISVVRQRTGM
jgi:ABC-type transporter Mla subunit MlaD